MSEHLKILVTGGAGFIGSHLVAELLQRGYKVIVLDNFSSGKAKNLPHGHPDLTIVEGDICDFSMVVRVVPGCSAIVHLAAVASVQASVDDPLATHNVNLVGTINLLEAARTQNVGRFVFSSSAAVYGNTKILPVSETTAPAPLTPYAADKLASEYYIDFYQRTYGISTAVFRFFNIFGPRQDPFSPYSGVISIFLQRAAARQPITVFGDGEQSRDFVYVADLVRLLAAAVELKEPFAAPMNVGNGEQISLNQLLETISEIASHPLAVTYADPRPGDIRHSCADNRSIREQLGYRNAYSVEAGLKLTYEWLLKP